MRRVNTRTGASKGIFCKLARHARSVPRLTMLAVALKAGTASAQTLIWDASGAAGNPTPPATDGAGFWNTTTNANWFDGTNPDALWVNGGIASIGSGGAGDVITINDGSGTVT